jgi:hypothetical protein
MYALEVNESGSMVPDWQQTGTTAEADNRANTIYPAVQLIKQSNN